VKNKKDAKDADEAKAKKDEMNARVSQFIKDLMYWRRINYKDLSKRFDKLGLDENPRQLTNKINRGQFSLLFFFHLLEALELRPEDVPWATLWGKAPLPPMPEKIAK